MMEIQINVWNIHVRPEFCSFIHAGNEADCILAKAVTQEEHSVLSDVGYEGWSGAFVQASQSCLSDGRQEAVDEAAVHGGERLHLHLCGVEWLTTQHTGCTTWAKMTRHGGLTHIDTTEVMLYHSGSV